MSDLGVRPEHIHHDIPDMSGVPVGRAVFLTAASAAPPKVKSTLEAAARGAQDALADANAAVVALISNPVASREYIRFLQWSGAAFTSARDLDLPGPDSLSQSQWNRALRDQGERLRAASLTLSSGHEKHAAEQLEGFLQFMTRYGTYLPI